jgi:hypothetical protein
VRDRFRDLKDRFRTTALVVGVVVMVALRPAPSAAQDAAAPPPKAPDPTPPAPAAEALPPVTQLAAQSEERPVGTYPVTRFTIEYAQPHSSLPDPDAVLQNIELSLVETDYGYRSPSPGDEGRATTIPLILLPELRKNLLHATAIQQVSRAIVAEYLKRGFLGISVTPHPQDISPQAVDLRPEDRTTFRMVVRIAKVAELRTIASGDRLKDQEPINNPVHKRIVERAPLQTTAAAEAAQAAGEEDPAKEALMRKDRLDAYVHRLNRHPGRHVNAAVSPSAAQPGDVAVDLHVHEFKPWYIYGQFSNTGTDQTDKWRERFGFVHNQLTNNDDIFSVDYTTAGFSAVHAFTGSYEAPFFGSERLRWRVGGLWSEFTASELGISGVEFEGEQWWGGADLIANVFQHNELFIDLLFGARYQRDELSGTGGLADGEEDFLVPRVGVQLQRQTLPSNTSILVQWEINALNVDREEMQGMGRDLGTGADDFTGEEHFSRLIWDASHSMYIEPVLWRNAWLDASTPESSTLAQELFFSFRGQWSDDRNILQFQRTAGGFFSVRGYDEAAMVGDTVLLTTVEYRFHLPRIFAIQPEPGTLFGQPFRAAPSQVYGMPDWDLIFRGFFDYGRTYSHGSDTAASQQTADLMSAGAGIEFSFKNNLNLRLDWGYVLEEIPGIADEGDNRFHFIATILY